MGNRRAFRLWAAAFATPLVAVVLLAAVDYVTAVWDQLKLGNAAFAGTRWGRANGYDPSRIAGAAQSEGKLSGITVNPSHLCGCAAGTGAVQFECDAPCPDGGWSQPYIVVTTSICYNTSLSWPRLPYCSSGDSQCAAAACTPRQVLLSAQSIQLQ